MMTKKIIFPLALSLLLLACSKDESPIHNNIPPLDEVSGIWVSADTADMEPSIRNFRGQALTNRDLASVSWFASAPYSGGYHTGVLRINGEAPEVSMFRWLPHQAIRQGKMDHWNLFSTVKMVPDENAIMWRVDISNDTSVARELDLSLDMIGFISKYGGDWQWWYPYPKLDGKTTVRDDEVENVRRHIGSKENSSMEKVIELIDGKPTPTDRLATWPSDQEILTANKYSAAMKNGTLVISDSETEAVTAFRVSPGPDSHTVMNSGGTAQWTRTLQPGQNITLTWVMSYGDREAEVTDRAVSLISTFDSTFMDVNKVWEERWHALFDPSGDLVSGTFPVLETEDEKLKKVYYTGPLTLLYMMHTNLPQHDMVYLTGGPRWGASITFFWDITEWATLWAVTDPEMMKEHLSAWILIDPSMHYGKDNFGGKGVGNGYSANYWALFQMIRNYVTVTRDFAFLEQEIDGKTVLQHLDNYALNWKNLSPFRQGQSENELYDLADFGDDEWNLLECVPTYKHIVPSFNAGYAWMMRELADLYEYTGLKGEGANERGAEKEGVKTTERINTTEGMNTTEGVKATGEVSEAMARNQEAAPAADPSSGPAESQAERAEYLRKEADAMIERILDLYAGDGGWYSLYPGGKKIEVRHCLDFMFLGRYIPEDIPGEIRTEMMDFLYEELMTDTWMRAQSLEDEAADHSDRPDHGPLGAFDGWPAGTMDALTQMGYPGKALDFYRAIEPVTYEGCWAQAHELWGENKYNNKARVRIAQRGWGNRESSGGISISQVMLKNFFGFYPDVKGNVLLKTAPPEFTGKLYHVLFDGEYYTLSAENGKVKMKKE